ncbi:MAG: DNA polymerase III subunit epsilon [Alphaproteobacteria bacterium]|nr:DNA polymerase III subunit epsilon [Alphaproteobacteria bacterium]
MREIVLDTETTGLDTAAGHRIVELGCVELWHRIPRGSFQRYVNPERDMPADAEAVHGLSAGFLADKPKFAEVAGDFLAFLGDSPLVIHNAGFDLRFLNAELERLGRPPIGSERAIDTVQLARRKFPGAPASLDALCRRLNIDASRRERHGALLDASLLAEVYLELSGGRQSGLELAFAAGGETGSSLERRFHPARPHAPSPAEAERHAAFLDRAVPNALWRR